jgi:hypothetical protein
MKSIHLIIGAAAGFVAFRWIGGQLLGKTNALAQLGPQEVKQADGSSFANGWQYFTDGTAIDPGGNYWKGGQRIYAAPAPMSDTWGRWG